MKQFNKYIILLLLIFVSSGTGMAQEVQILDFYTLGNTGQAVMKARIGLNGKQIKNVEVGPISLNNGAFTVTNNGYTLIENEYLNIPFSLSEDLPNRVAYRMIVTLSDNTKLISPSVRGDKAEAYLWLSDLDWTQATSGWKTPQKDKGVGGPLILIDGKQYHKGISNHTYSGATPAIFEYNIPFEASMFYTLIGAQDTEYNGDIDVRILLDEAVQSRDTLFARTNSALNNHKVSEERMFYLYGDKKKLRLEGYCYDGNNAGDWCNYAMAHFVMPFKRVVQKEQTIEFVLNTLNPANERYILQGRATSGLPLSYTIISGEDLGRIVADTLFVNHGVKGEITVQANQFGDDRFMVAQPVEQTIAVDREMKFRAHGILDYEGVPTLFYSFNPASKAVRSVSLNIYRSIELMELVESRDLSVSSMGEGSYKFALPDVDSNNVYRPVIVYQDGTEMNGPLFDCAGDNIVFMSDLSYEARGGYGHGYRADVSYDNSQLEILDQVYSKGFGIFTTGWVKVRNLDRFNRFCTDFGYHKGYSGDAIATLKLDDLEVQNSGVFRNNVKLHFDQSLNGEGVLEVHLNANGSNWNEIIDLGAARFYEKPANIRSQNIIWDEFVEVKANEPVIFDLTARATSSNPVYYRIVKGHEYASLIENASKLSINAIPAEAEIVVEAFQPGDLEFAAAEPKRCSYQMKRAVVVQAFENCTLPGGTDIEELIVHGNTFQSGQVRISNGVVNIKKLYYKFKMMPGKSHILSFPVSADINRISDLSAQGYVFNEEGENGWQLKEYNGEDRALNGQREQNWSDMSSTVVEPFKGYMLVAPQRAAGESVDVTFEFENVALDMNNAINPMNLTLDFSGRLPHEDYRVYVKPENVKGNTLTISVAYRPSVEDLPLNYKQVVDNTRLVSFNNGKSFRITLPVAHIPAQVFLLDRKGKKVLKAYEYYAPASIDIPNLKKGSYPVLVRFGDEVSSKTLCVE